MTLSDFDAVPGAEPVAGDLYASRRFILSSPYGKTALTGLTVSQPILPGVNIASCALQRNHSVPAEDCSCGFYAFDKESPAYSTRGLPAIEAVVRLSGKVVVCEGGLRAERMEVVAVASTDEEARETASRLVDAPAFETKSAMLEEFPLTPVKRHNPKRTQAPPRVGLKNRLKGFRKFLPKVLTVALFALFALAFVVQSKSIADTLPDNLKALSVLTVFAAMSLVAKASSWRLRKILWVFCGIGAPTFVLIEQNAEALKGLGLADYAAVAWLHFVAVGLISLFFSIAARPTAPNVPRSAYGGSIPAVVTSAAPPAMGAASAAIVRMPPKTAD